MPLKVSFLLSLLNNNLAGYKILGWQLFSFSMLRMFLHCLLATVVAKNKSLSAYWFLQVFFCLYSLVAFRSFFLITDDLCVHVLCPQSVLCIRRHMSFAVMKILSCNFSRYYFSIISSILLFWKIYQIQVGAFQGIFHVC